MRLISISVLTVLAEKDLIGCQPTTPRCKKTPAPLPDDSLDIQEMDGAILDLEFAGRGDEVVFVRTGSIYGQDGGSLWRNDKMGQKVGWAKMDPLLQSAAEDANLTLYSGVSVLEIVRNPFNVHHILVRGHERVNWITRDLGSSYLAVSTPANTLGSHTYWIKPHETEPEWLLALVKGNNCFQATETSWAKCTNDLFFSDDFGQSWKNLTANAAGRVASFITADWGWKLGEKASDSMPKETILATVFENAEDFQLHEAGWDNNAAFIISKDMFESKHETVVPCGNQFKYAQGKIFLAKTSTCEDTDGSKNGKGQAAHKGLSTVEMHISSDMGKSFEEACFPVPLKDNGYFLVEMERQTFILIDHDDVDFPKAVSPTDNLYNSDSGSTVFTLSLPNVYTTRYSTDFHHVGGINGIFIANQVDASAFRDPDIINGKSKWQDYLVTKISRDGGSEWMYLNPPLVGADSKEYTCSSCSLNLHGVSSWTYQEGLSPLYSHHSAPGIIMGVGNVGERLTYDKDFVNTYISVDAGQNWDEICKGSHIYEFGDHGGVIVMARHATDGPTDHLWFSLDEGECWEGPVRFQYTINLQNVRVEPRGASHLFMLHGSTCLKSTASGCTADSSTSVRGVVIAFDVEKVLPSLSTCTEADFTTWSPTLGNCILGENITITQRKRTSTCFNGLDFSRSIQSTPCNCTVKDTECDFGSFYDSTRRECIHLADFELLKDTCPAITNGEYQLSANDSRFISNDKCVHKSDIIPDAKDNDSGSGSKPKDSSGGSWLGKSVSFLLVVLLLLFIVSMIWTFLPDSNKESCLNILPDSIGDLVGRGLETLATILKNGFYYLKDLIFRVRYQEGNSFEPLSGGDEFLVDYHDIQSARPLS